MSSKPYSTYQLTWSPPLQLTPQLDYRGVIRHSLSLLSHNAPITQPDIMCPFHINSGIHTHTQNLTIIVLPSTVVKRPCPLQQPMMYVLTTPSASNSQSGLLLHKIPCSVTEIPSVKCFYTVQSVFPQTMH